MQWFEYIKKRGSLHTGRRLESGFALLAQLYVAGKGGKSSIYDFMPHEDQPEASLEDIAAVFGLSVPGAGESTADPEEFVKRV